MCGQRLLLCGTCQRLLCWHSQRRLPRDVATGWRFRARGHARHVSGDDDHEDDDHEDDEGSERSLYSYPFEKATCSEEVN